MKYVHCWKLPKETAVDVLGTNCLSILNVLNYAKLSAADVSNLETVVGHQHNRSYKFLLWSIMAFGTEVTNGLSGADQPFTKCLSNNTHRPVVHFNDISLFCSLNIKRCELLICFRFVTQKKIVLEEQIQLSSLSS